MRCAGNLHDFEPSKHAVPEEQLPEIFAASDLVLESDVMKAVHRVTREIRYPMG